MSRTSWRRSSRRLRRRDAETRTGDGDVAVASAASAAALIDLTSLCLRFGIGLSLCLRVSVCVCACVSVRTCVSECVGALWPLLRSAWTTYENELKPKRALHASKSVTSTALSMRCRRQLRSQRQRQRTTFNPQPSERLYVCVCVCLVRCLLFRRGSWRCCFNCFAARCWLSTEAAAARAAVCYAIFACQRDGNSAHTFAVLLLHSVAYDTLPIAGAMPALYFVLSRLHLRDCYLAVSVCTGRPLTDSAHTVRVPCVRVTACVCVWVSVC